MSVPGFFIFKFFNLRLQSNFFNLSQRPKIVPAQPYVLLARSGLRGFERSRSSSKIEIKWWHEYDNLFGYKLN